MAESFHNLRIWQDGFSLLMELYDIIEEFPREERFSLTDQILGAGNSVIANIAEASGRYHYQDKVRVLYQARGEIHEVRSHLAVAWGRGYVNDEQFKHLDGKYEELTKNLNGFINSLKEEKVNSVPVN